MTCSELGLRVAGCFLILSYRCFLTWRFAGFYPGTNLVNRPETLITSAPGNRMHCAAAVVILSLKLVAASPLELSMVGQDITGGPLWPSESWRGAPKRELSTLNDQRELLQTRSEESIRFWMGSLPHTVRRTAASDGESASPHVRSGREVFQDVWWGTRGVPGTFAPVMLVAVMLSVAALALLIASTVHVREPDQEQVDDR